MAHVDLCGISTRLRNSPPGLSRANAANDENGHNANSEQRLQNRASPARPMLETSVQQLITRLIPSRTLQGSEKQKNQAHIVRSSQSAHSHLVSLIGELSANRTARTLNICNDTTPEAVSTRSGEAASQRASSKNRGLSDQRRFHTNLAVCGEYAAHQGVSICVVHTFDARKASRQPPS